MSPGVQFPASAVLRHAAATDEASELMAQARSAVQAVTMDSEAYGQLCRFLPALLNPLFGDAAGAISGAVEALGEAALKLRSTATALQAADTASARRVDAAGPGIELPL